MAQFLYQTIEALEQAGFLQDIPEFIEQGFLSILCLEIIKEGPFNILSPILRMRN